MIEDTRIRILNQTPPRQGRYVLYWMQQAQRVNYNHALAYAVDQANARDIPVIVGFGLTADYPEANERHYAFMLENLAEVAQTLQSCCIGFVIRLGSPDAVALTLSKDAALLVADRGYLRPQKHWRECVARQAECQVVEVEADVVVPVDVVSQRHEPQARSIRPKLKKHWDTYLHPLAQPDVKHPATDIDLLSDMDIAATDSVLQRLDIDRSVGRVNTFKGGENQAKQRLQNFIGQYLQGYGQRRNDPGAQTTSSLSPYLHFGQISPVEVGVAIRNACAERGQEQDADAFLEELIVRRELAMNFVHHEPHYDSYRCLPEWAQKTLQAHRDDPRPDHYTRAELEAAQTHDPYWNAAMREMKLSGYMQGYMRMYWGKKILEWTNTPEYGYQTTLYLNNKYFLDGRDANSFANVAWCFGLHDHAWKERSVFGKVRYMNANGLKRKFNMDAYLERVAQLADASA